MSEVPLERFKRRAVAAIVAAVAFWTSPVTFGGDTLTEGFQSPPLTAKPRAWWHWMNGNVTLTGVRADLEWMRRVGIGGIQNFDAALYRDRVVDPPLTYLTPGWRKAFRFSVELADELDLDFDIESTAGWSVSGAPWVEPRRAMKKLVWSETRIEGGARFSGRLTEPPKTTGLFQNIPLATMYGTEVKGLPTHYADVAVIAYRAPSSEAIEGPQPTVRSSAGFIDAGRLNDGDLDKAVSLPFNGDKPAWVQFSFPEPERIQAISAVIGVNTRNGGSSWEMREAARLEASDDGRSFKKIVDLPQTGAPQQTISFAPVVARMFRIVLERPQPMMLESAPQTTHQIAELVLHRAARINRFEDKAGFSTQAILGGDNTPSFDATDVIKQVDVVDLSGRMRSDGTLDWTPPNGPWMVLRFGYSLLGKTNHPASPGASGFEIDKLNRSHVAFYIENYLRPYEQAVGPRLMGQHGLRNMHVGSYEAGPQNWTEDLLEQFKRRRGYEARPWLPALTGRVIGSAAASDGFLWDFRQTLGDLLVEAHYGEIAAALGKRGLGSYFESHAERRAFMVDGMRIKSLATIPMGEMWIERIACCDSIGEEVYGADILESASVAHLYGKRFVAAESFTTATVPYAKDYPYSTSPQEMKPTADNMLAMGINRFVLHASVHQPSERPGPGFTLGAFGQWFTRKETWADQAGAWIDYLTRSSYLLQQGRFVADIALLYGEDTNITALFKNSSPAIPEGYKFDFINADALLNELTVRDGYLVSSSGGMTYRILALDPSTARMSFRVLRKIRDLVAAGAVVIGPKPIMTPSLADDAEEFRRLADKLWNQDRAISGAVIADCTLANAMPRLGIAPAFTYTKPYADTKLLFTQRAMEQGEVYFINSRNSYAQRLETSFRTTGRVPELWRADTGEITPISYRTVNGRTVVPLTLEANDAVFILFRRGASAASVDVPQPTIKPLTVLQGPWEVSFPQGLGAPDRIRLDRLESWTDSMDPGVKYFSGTATYSTTLSVPSDWLERGTRLQLDLGKVKEVAEVRVNGRSAGVVWKAPFTLDVTSAIKVGVNRLEIRVSNLWRNRLIGDKQPGAKPIAYATHDPFKADSPLLPAGLLGPVAVLGVSVEESAGET